MGRTHRLETTFPRLSEPLGFVPKEDILYAVKAIVVTQRENGRRDDRKYSRMKYLIDSWGIEKFRSVVEQYYGKKFEPIHELPDWEFKSFLGWHEQVCPHLLDVQLLCDFPPIKKIYNCFHFVLGFLIIRSLHKWLRDGRVC